jgi:hypothetical protein
VASCFHKQICYPPSLSGLIIVTNSNANFRSSHIVWYTASISRTKLSALQPIQSTVEQHSTSLGNNKDSVLKYFVLMIGKKSTE